MRVWYRHAAVAVVLTGRALTVSAARAARRSVGVDGVRLAFPAALFAAGLLTITSRPAPASARASPIP